MLKTPPGRIVNNWTPSKETDIVVAAEVLDKIIVFE
jgi:hypothetical protein